MISTWVELNKNLSFKGKTAGSVIVIILIKKIRTSP